MSKKNNPTDELAELSTEFDALHSLATEEAENFKKAMEAKELTPSQQVQHRTLIQDAFSRLTTMEQNLAKLTLKQLKFQEHRVKTTQPKVETPDEE